MQKQIIFFALAILTIFTNCAQKKPLDYQGEWIGFLPDKESFNFKVNLENLGENIYKITLSNQKTTINKEVESSSDEKIIFDIDKQLFFDLSFEKDRNILSGFIKSGRFLYHTILNNTGRNTYSGDWNPFMFTDRLQSDDIMLYVEKSEEGDLSAYPFFGDQRFRGTWTSNFRQEGDRLYFRDSNGGFNFCASLLENNIELEIFLVNTLLTKTSLTHTNDGWEYKSNPIKQSVNTDRPQTLKDGWITGSIEDYDIKGAELTRLIKDIDNDKLVNTHSVLIAKEGKLVFESYFDGFNVNIPHDLRSASKSISSAMIGIAIQDGILKAVDETLYDHIPEEYQYTKDSLKSKIKIKDLLTMSSGLDVNNLASEDYYQNPNNKNSWLKSVLEAPMINEPGTYADYGSANPFLLGVVLDQNLNIPLEKYMHEKLFAPLQITNYINQTDDSDTVPYFGGGMLLTSRDLLKFGQLYLNKGEWKGKQIISAEWVEESFKKHVRLQDVKDKNFYGYLWWHDTYKVGEKVIPSIEARGAGGQFIFILPKLKSVVVITSGNFRNKKGNQPREILKEYILPALLN